MDSNVTPGWRKLVAIDRNDLPVGREFDGNFLKNVKSPLHLIYHSAGFNKPMQIVNLTITKGENASLECGAQGFPLHVE